MAAQVWCGGSGKVRGCVVRGLRGWRDRHCNRRVKQCVPGTACRWMQGSCRYMALSLSPILAFYRTIKSYRPSRHAPIRNVSFALPRGGHRNREGARSPQPHVIFRHSVRIPINDTYHIGVHTQRINGMTFSIRIFCDRILHGDSREGS